MYEVFKFMTLRTPRSVQDHEIAKLKSESEYQKDLLKSLQADDALDEIIKRSRDFIASKRYVFDLDQLSTLLKFGDRLRETPNLSAETVIPIIDEVFGQSAEELVQEDFFARDIQNVADSLIALTIIHEENSPNYEKLVETIRLCRLLERVATNDATLKEVGAFEKALDQIVVLPRNIFPLPGSRSEAKTAYKEQEEIRKVLTKQKESVVKAARRLEKLQIAMDELQTFRASDFRRVEKIPVHKVIYRKKVREISEAEKETIVEIPETEEEPNPWILSDEAINRLSPKTSSEIDALRISLANTPLPEVTQILEQELIKVGKQVYLPTPSTKVVKIGSNFYPISKFQDEYFPAGILIPEDPQVATPSLRELIGMVDLQVVKQEIQRYEAGEVGHIENILKGESNERIHRRLNRTEESYLTETETTTTTEKDLQSTERFELQREAQETIKEDTAFDATVTAKYGTPTFSIEAGAKYLTKSDSEKSARSATNYAREVTEKSVSRIQERVREQRTRLTIEEIEEKTTHGFNNKDGEGHVIGIYRWVDKIYKAQVFSYGLRTMYEFIIPEPAAFTIFAKNNKPPEGVTLDKPEPPKGPLSPYEIVLGLLYGFLPLLQAAKKSLTPELITPDNYQQWVGQYGVQGIEPPPPIYKTVEYEWKTSEKPQEGKLLYQSATGNIKIPEGYEAESVVFQALKSPKVHSVVGKWGDENYREDWDIPEGTFIQWAIGADINEINWSLRIRRPYDLINTENTPIKKPYRTGVIPIAIQAVHVYGVAATVSILCKRTDELSKWQHKTYDAIMAAYLNLKSEYEEQLAAASIQEGIVISGRNPALNRELERDELKKGALWLLTQKNRITHFNGIGAMSAANPPEIDIKKLDQQAPIIQFMEQAFEWNQMIYTLYPYFWARKELWDEMQQLEDPDPIHAKFLRAGAARVWVPVRPYYEGAIRHYWNTGEPWKGIDPSSVTDEGFVSVINTIKEELGNYYRKGEGTISVQKDNTDVTGKDTKFSQTDQDFEIIIKGKQYRIGRIESDTHIVLTEKYSGDSTADIPYSIGAKFVGEPWDVRIPTSLVILQEDAKKLPDFTTHD